MAAYLALAASAASLYTRNVGSSPRIGLAGSMPPFGFPVATAFATGLPDAADLELADLGFSAANRLAPPSHAAAHDWTRSDASHRRSGEPNRSQGRRRRATGPAPGRR